MWIREGGVYWGVVDERIAGALLDVRRGVSLRLIAPSSSSWFFFLHVTWPGAGPSHFLFLLLPLRDPHVEVHCTHFSLSFEWLRCDGRGQSALTMWVLVKVLSPPFRNTRATMAMTTTTTMLRNCRGEFIRSRLMAHPHDPPARPIISCRPTPIESSSITWICLQGE